jgi:ribosomal protein S18 acetylase RimI-like enzyme
MRAALYRGTREKSTKPETNDGQSTRNCVIDEGYMNSAETRWSELAAENEAELVAYLGTAAGATSQRATDLTWVVTGVNNEAYNGVLWTRLSPAAADLQVQFLVEQFRFQGLPALWRIDAATEPADLGARLRALGCTPLPDGICMGAQLPALAREMSRFPGLTVERVTSASELAEWLDVWTETSGEPREPRQQLYESLGFGARQPLHHYVARIDGQPAGVAELFLGQRAAGLYSLAVAPAYRGRGIGTALVLTPLLVARTTGYDTGVVQPPSESRVMFEHLGFEPVPQPSIGYRIA